MRTQDGGYKPSVEAMKQLISERLKLAERLINEDLENGIFAPEDAESFESLHEVTDPNCYVSDEGDPASVMEKDLLNEYETEDWINYWQVLIEAVDSWLRSGMKGRAVDNFQDEDLVERLVNYR